MRTHTIEAYYRYDGEGVLSVKVDAYGTTHVSSTKGKLAPVSISEIQIESRGLV